MSIPKPKLKITPQIATYLAFIILAIVFIVSLIVSSQESTTMDEKAHIPAAYSYMQYNDMRLNPEHPPLLKDIAGLPLLFMNLKFPTETPEWKNGINEQWVLGDKFLHYSGNDAEKITFWSRVPVLLCALILGFFIFLWTKELAGIGAGLFALLLYAADPNMLGHNHYVTTDLGIMATIFIAYYFFIKFLKKPFWPNLALAAVALAVAQLTKFSAVLLFPIFFILGVFYFLIKKYHPSQKRLGETIKFIGHYALIILICFVIIWIIYFFNTFNMPAEKIKIIADTQFPPENNIKILANQAITVLNNNVILRPLSEYFLGVFMVFARVAGGNTYYYLGQVYKDAVPSYFPVVFLLKMTIPFLALLLISIILTLKQFITNFIENFKNKSLGKSFKKYCQNSLVEYSMLSFVAFYPYLSITGNLAIGIRHIFPIFPFMYLLVSWQLFKHLKTIRNKFYKNFFVSVLALLMIFIILEPIVQFPSFLSYFNQAAGGPQNGYKYVTDSNIDWGQDLKRLSIWVDKYNDGCYIKKYNSRAHFCAETPHPKINKIRVDYFGGSSPEYYLKDKYKSWHNNLKPEPGWYAISVLFLQEDLHKKEPGHTPGYTWLKNREPTAKVGDSIFVYYLE